jgi:thioredoxin-related protein
MPRILVLSVLLLATACSRPPDPPVPPPKAAAPAGPVAAAAPAAAAEIAWEKGDVDAAFVKAKAENKPLFLYWGAVWCPPCNQVKATLFNRQDFIERSRHFVPVYLDGDSKSAQRQGARFRIGGYPTMILFTPDGTEITRLPGEADAEQYMQVLALGMGGARPVKTTLAAALAKGGAAQSPLSADDWRMLAYYSWDTDEQALIPKKDLAATLRRLAQACPPAETVTAARLKLKALAAEAKAPGAKPVDDPGARDELAKMLANPQLVRESFDLVTGYPREITGQVSLPKSDGRAALVAAWDAVLVRLAADASLSAADRLSAVGARIDLARLDAGDAKLPEPLLASARETAARGDKETTNPYARETVINGAAYVLASAGLLDESDALLTAELARSNTPYYAMLGLASNAKKRGDKAGAVDWAEKAYTAATGPATRLQWGVSYVGTLVDLTPEATGRIEKAAGQVIGELEPVPDTFYDRNHRYLERMAKKLGDWNKDKARQDAVRRLRTQFAGVCAKLPAGDPARASCDGVWNPAKVAAS